MCARWLNGTALGERKRKRNRWGWAFCVTVTLEWRSSVSREAGKLTRHVALQYRKVWDNIWLEKPVQTYSIMDRKLNIPIGVTRTNTSHSLCVWHLKAGEEETGIALMGEAVQFPCLGRQTSVQAYYSLPTVSLPVEHWNIVGEALVVSQRREAQAPSCQVIIGFWTSGDHLWQTSAIIILWVKFTDSQWMEGDKNVSLYHSVVIPEEEQVGNWDCMPCTFSFPSPSMLHVCFVPWPFSQLLFRWPRVMTFSGRTEQPLWWLLIVLSWARTGSGVVMPCIEHILKPVLSHISQCSVATLFWAQPKLCVCGPSYPICYSSDRNILGEGKPDGRQTFLWETCVSMLSMSDLGSGHLVVKVAIVLYSVMWCVMVLFYVSFVGFIHSYCIPSILLLLCL